MQGTNEFRVKYAHCAQQPGHTPWRNHFNDWDCIASKQKRHDIRATNTSSRPTTCTAVYMQCTSYNWYPHYFYYMYLIINRIANQTKSTNHVFYHDTPSTFSLNSSTTALLNLSTTALLAHTAYISPLLHFSFVSRGGLNAPSIAISASLFVLSVHFIRMITKHGFSCSSKPFTICYCWSIFTGFLRYTCHNGGASV